MDLQLPGDGCLEQSFLILVFDLIECSACLAWDNALWGMFADVFDVCRCF
jgi:hypothetical protein